MASNVNIDTVGKLECTVMISVGSMKPRADDADEMVSAENPEMMELATWDVFIRELSIRELVENARIKRAFPAPYSSCSVQISSCVPTD